MANSMTKNPFSLRNTLAPTISLFVSTGTLVCCALPALMVSLGMGAVLAGLVSDFPALIWLSQNKVFVFGLSAIMIALAGGMLWYARTLPCPIDPAKAKACKNLRVFSWWVWGISIFFFLIGGFFAFIAPKLIGN